MYDNDEIIKKQNAKKIIKKKFLEVYKKEPLNRIKVSDLAAACEISRGTFYFHFEDVYALYRACEQDMIDFLEDGISEIHLVSLLRDHEKHIEVYSRFLKKYIANNEMIKCFLQGSEEASFRQVWFNSIYQKFEKSMTFSFDMPQAKRNNLVRFFAGGMLALQSNWVLTGCREPVEDIARIHEQVLYDGILFNGSEKYFPKAKS